MGYKWTYEKIGGNTQVVIKSGKDIQHLAELDKKLWAVLACPVSGLEIPDESLALIDHDHDNKIHVKDVVSTSQWLCEVLVNPDVLLDRKDSLPIDAIKDDAIKQQAINLSQDGVVSLSAVKDAIAKASAETQPMPQAPYAADVIAAYKSCKEGYMQFFQTQRLQTLGLAVLPADAVVPGMAEEEFVEMGKKIDEYEASKASIEAANAAALAQVQTQYRPLEKLLILCRDFCTLLCNFVSFQDFYSKRKNILMGHGSRTNTPWAVFQAGTLIIDQRACNLCLRVNNMAKHDVQAPDSGMFLIYCNCTHHASGEKMQIVAAMTVGDVNYLKVGKNALFYDRQGRDWEAEVFKIVDNPISIGQAFWTPYRKMGEWVSNLITKSAADKEKKSFDNITSKLETVAPNANAKQPAAVASSFDIAKFAGIFAAIGMALGYIGAFFTSLLNQFITLKWRFLWVLPGILLLISGPSMVLAWMKLRRRNLSPLLNANGWVINASAIVSVPFGNTLTEKVQYPLKGLPGKRISKCGKWAIAVAVVLAVAAITIGAMCLFGCGIPCIAC